MIVSRKRMNSYDDEIGEIAEAAEVRDESVAEIVTSRCVTRCTCLTGLTLLLYIGVAVVGGTNYLTYEMLTAWGIVRQAGSPP